jgi:uncharacterized protein YjcR
MSDTNSTGKNGPVTESGGESQNEPKYRDESWLREQYLKQKRSTVDIAEDCGCHNRTVGRWLKKYGIETRGPSGSLEKRLADDRLTDSEWLRDQYVTQRRSMAEISELCDCSPATVENWLEKHGIETRGPQGCLEKRIADQRLIDGDWLREQYVENRKTADQIAQLCGCSNSTVLRWLRKHGIEVRDRVATQKADPRLADEQWLRRQYVDISNTSYEIAEICGCSSHPVLKWLDRHGIERRGPDAQLDDERLKDSEWLREQYVKKGLSTSDIANKADCCKTTVRNWLDRHGIETRDSNPSGEDHPLWNGGRVPYGAGWNESKKEFVRQRDSYTCQDPRCSVTQAEHEQTFSEKLHVHHLRKARNVDDPEERNATENLITLCRPCHRRWEKMADAGLVPEVER